MAQSVVLLSSGLDSTVNLYEAHRDGRVVLALFIDYGQRAAFKESRNSSQLCEELGIPFKKLDLNFIGDLGGSSLTDSKIDLATNVEIDSLSASKISAKNVWVPNRNGIFLNVAAGFAEALGAQFVVPGFNLEEASTFPDNSAGFMKALDNSFSFSTSSAVEVKCYTVNKNKTEIYRRAKELGVNLELVWPCYKSGDELCGICESCQRFFRAKLEVENAD